MTPQINKRVTIFINPSIVKQAKAQAISDGVSLTNLVEKSLISYLPKETVFKSNKGGENK